ncbi:MAG: helix-turn-helix transcriptional regulator [Atopobiaceae bacterium]|nr:helix-turn-helix transcriptional regulator [Atopobiaceae bacterium]
MTFGEMSLKLMRERGISQAELEQRSDMSKQSITELIKDRSKGKAFSKAKALADVLDVTLEEMAGMVVKDES